MCILGPNLVISCCSWWEGHQFLLQQWEGTGRGRCNFRWSSGFWMGLFRVRKSSVREEQEIFAWMCCLNCTFQTCTVNMTDWRVCYGGHWIRDLLFTSLCADLIARGIDRRMCQRGAENTCSKGQNYSVNKGKWSKAFMEMYIMTSYLYTLYQICKT